MTGNQHLIYGMTLTGMAALNLDKIAPFLPITLETTPETKLLLLMGGIIGSVFPDIDNPDSYIGKMTRPVSTIIAAIGGLFGKTGYKHRWIFHDIGLYVTAFILSCFYFTPLAGFLLGCVSHVFLDSFTAEGVPVFFFFRLRLGKMKADSVLSSVFVFTQAAIFLLLGIGAGFIIK